MGEIADAMLDGTLCSCCGTYLADESYGYPITCAACGGDDVPEPPRRRRERPPPPPKPARKPTSERMTSPLNIAARVLARMPVTEAEQRILAHFALNNASPKLRADLAAAFPPIPTPTQEGQGILGRSGQCRRTAPTTTARDSYGEWPTTFIDDGCWDFIEKPQDQGGLT